MNPQRLVAAVAALAIGFGVTLVGVGVADDGSDSIATQIDEQAADATDSADAAVEPAEQEEEQADEPEEAEVEDASTSPSEPTAQQGQPSENAPSEPVPTSAPTPSNPPTNTRNDPQADDSFPESGVQCAIVLRLVYDDRTEFVVLVDDLGDDEYRVLDSNGESTIDLNGEPGLQDAVSGPRSVEFENGLPVKVGDFCDLGDDDPGGGIGTDVDVDASQAGAMFPCSDRAFEAVVAPLSDLELTEFLDERDVFLAAIATRFAALGSGGEDFWFVSLGREFDSFAEFPNGCPNDIESAFIDDGVGFYCAAAQISNDDDLFRFFQSQVSQAMVGCTLENVSGQGGN